MDTTFKFVEFFAVDELQQPTAAKVDTQEAEIGEFDGWIAVIGDCVILRELKNIEISEICALNDEMTKFNVKSRWNVAEIENFDVIGDVDDAVEKVDEMMIAFLVSVDGLQTD